MWDLAADELERLASKTEGDVLIFMPGKYEIDRTISAIRASRVSDRFVALPLYGELPPAEQDAALARYEKRKAIVATNVAETSLTIEGVRVVIDSGLARIARFDPRRGINTLLIEKISSASAEQRAGRAGRTAPGHCLRLWTEREHLERAAQELPEVKRLDLAEVVLTLKASGVDETCAHIADARGRRACAGRARESAMHDARLIVASEIREIETSDKERQVLLTIATRIEEEWLRELFAEAFQQEMIVAFDATQRRVIGRRETRFHDLILRSETSSEVSAESAAAILAREVFDGNLALKNWDNSVEQWIARVNCAAQWFPEMKMPRIGDAEKLSLLEQICHGAFSYREIKDRAVWSVVKSWLGLVQQNALDELAPERVKIPTGGQ